VRDLRKRPCETSPHGTEATGSVDRGEQAAGSPVEGEPCVLPGRVLAESSQPLHRSPRRTPDSSHAAPPSCRRRARALRGRSSRCVTASITFSRVSPSSWALH
jgi:hypothetical protein